MCKFTYPGKIWGLQDNGYVSYMVEFSEAELEAQKHRGQHIVQVFFPAKSTD